VSRKRKKDGSRCRKCQALLVEQDEFGFGICCRCGEFHSFLGLLKRAIEEGRLTREAVLAAIDETEEQPMASRRSKLTFELDRALGILKPASSEHRPKDHLWKLILKNKQEGFTLRVEVRGTKHGLSVYVGSRRFGNRYQDYDSAFFREVVEIYYKYDCLEFRARRQYGQGDRYLKILPSAHFHVWSS